MGNASMAVANLRNNQNEMVKIKNTRNEKHHW